METRFDPSAQARPLVSIGCLIVLLGLLPASVRAAEIEGVRFAERVAIDDAEFQLVGTGLLRYRYVIKAYVAALYLDPRSADRVPRSDVVRSDVARRLEIEYFWPLDAEDFAAATVEGVARHADRESLARMRERIDRFNAFYRDVEPGDRYALTYVPGVGTELSFNDQPLGVVEGSDFAEAMFAIWLGENALDEGLRDQLLARDELRGARVR